MRSWILPSWILPRWLRCLALGSWLLACGAPDASESGCDACASVPILCGELGAACAPGFECSDAGHCVGATEVMVPGGAFWQGCHPETLACDFDESPQHAVSVPPFAIDRLEVRMGDYLACVADGTCSAPKTGPYCNVERPDNHDLPANCLTWQGARAYCQDQGRDLCTESQWELAARGTCAMRGLQADDPACGQAMPVFPWGNAAATCERAVMDEGAGSGCGTLETAPVGGRPKGASPYGAQDMAGNVWEWTLDCYVSRYHGAPDDGTPWETADCSRRTVRGGGFHYGATEIRATTRDGMTPTEPHAALGFRCCRAL